MRKWRQDSYGPAGILNCAGERPYPKGSLNSGKNHEKNDDDRPRAIQEVFGFIQTLQELIGCQGQRAETGTL